MARSQGNTQVIPASPSAASEKLKLNWSDLASSSRYVRRAGWELRPIPEELGRLPGDVVIPEALQQILAWSLVPGSNWSYQPPKKATGEICAQGPDANRQHIEQCSGAYTDNKTETLTPTSSLMCETTLTQTSSSIRGHSPHGERSLKTKLLSKIGLNKSSDRLPPSTAKAAPLTAECTSCFEDLPESEMTRLKSCRHWYCKECLSTLIVTAMGSEASFPPKCCLSPIPLQQILKALSANQRESYKVKAAEYAVPTTERWYCPNTDCLKWIPGSKLKINKELGYDCPHCAAKLCRTCRGAAHPKNIECPQDYGLEATLEIAEVEGWQRCYQCRALVEHNTGCRHMTCRCKAQFCYVCGLRWQTCQCTETDASNKRAGAQQRRQDRTAILDAEAAEIARAIAEVEEMEQREAEERQLQAEQREREEEEQLRLLEAMRLEDEIKRNEQAKQAERDFRNTLVRSFDEEWNQIEDIYRKIMAFQSTALVSRHECEDSKLATMHVKDEEEAKRDLDAFNQILWRHSEKRRCKLVNKQKADLEALEIRQEEEEDDLFLQVQMRLRGKANKDSRMERMLSEIRKQQDEEKTELQQKWKLDLTALETKLEADAQGLERRYEARIQETRDKQTIALQKLGHLVGADRQYFEVVFERRNKMLMEHSRKALASIEAGEEPVGLTEYDASKIEPFLPELDDGEPGPSGITRGSDVVMTTHGPLKINRFHGQRSSHNSIDQHNNVQHAGGMKDLSNGQQTFAQHQLPQSLPIPGSFPAEPVSFEPDLAPPPLQTRRQPPSPQPQPTPSPTLVNMVTPRYPSPTPIKLDTNPPRPNAQQTADSISVLTTASLVAGMALAVPPQQQPTKLQRQQQQQQQQDMKIATVAFVKEIEPTSSPDHRRSSQSSSVANMKKSRWSFKNLKSKEMTEDEFRRKMNASVGDAF